MIALLELAPYGLAEIGHITNDGEVFRLLGLFGADEPRTGGFMFDPDPITIEGVAIRVMRHAGSEGASTGMPAPSYREAV